MKELIEKAGLLVEALPYIQDFRGAIVVVKFGGSAMDVPELIESTLRDVVLMEIVGMRPVIVHGGGKAISRRLNEIGVQEVRTGGMRHTCDVSIKVVDDVLHNDHRVIRHCAAMVAHLIVIDRDWCLTCAALRDSAD